MSALRASLLILALLLGVSGCKKDPPGGATAADAGPKAGAALSPADPILGTVAERLDAPNYTYLRLTRPEGEIWAAVPTTTVGVGSEVRITKPLPMQNFESKTLGRTFEAVIFGAAAEAVGGAVAAPVQPTPASVDLSNIKVAKPPGPDGRTIAEVHAQRMKLKGKQASVRGRVVKVTGGVLGRTWLHLRDGSGSDAAKDNDLIVTTATSVKLNDEVTAKGVVRTDKDLGSGYTYPVLIEDAKVSP